MNIARKIILLSALFSLLHSNAQQNKADSLILEFNSKLNHDTSSVYLLINIYETLKVTNFKDAKIYASKLDSLAKALDFKVGIGLSLNCKGNILEIEDKYDSALIVFTKALNYQNQIKDKKGIGKSLGNIANMHLFHGKYKIAIEYYFKSIKIQEEINDEKGKGNNFNNLGVAYYYLQNYNKAEEYWLYTVNSFEKQDNKQGMAYSLNNLGMIANNFEDFDIAIAYYEQAYEILTEIEDKKGMASALNNIAEVYTGQNKYDLALEKYNQAYQLKLEMHDKRGLAIVLDNIGKIHFIKKEYKKSINKYNEVKKISFEIGFLDELKDAYENLSEVYEADKNLDSALFYQKLFANIKDSIYTSENAKSIAEMQTKYQSEKKEKENELLKKDNDLHKATIAKKQIFEYALGSGILMLILIAGLIFYQFRLKKKANFALTEQNNIIEEKNHELNQLIEEIASHRDQIEGQKSLLEKKNHDILSSIQYAKRIQEAILPSKSKVENELPNSFILYKPKDIVSGDFYWIEKIQNKVLFSAVDCTGHGVPGAFMSIIGHNGLTKALHEQNLTTPSKILDFLDFHVKDTLQKSTEGNIIKDGMDIALCSWDSENLILEYSGAYNSLYIISKETYTLENCVPISEFGYNLYEIKANKQPIGFTSKEKEPFVNHTFKLSKGDSVYIFSDGFADQFGGINEKKFMTKNMKKMFLENQNISMVAQMDAYNVIFENWKNTNDQLDDICIIGMKV